MDTGAGRGTVVEWGQRMVGGAGLDIRASSGPPVGMDQKGEARLGHSLAGRQIVQIQRREGWQCRSLELGEGM